jgi:anti-anti-sigma factor
MELTEAKRGDVVIITVKGKLDVFTSPALEEKLRGLIAAEEKQVVVDLSEVDYISSSGLEAFLVGAKKAREISGQLALCGLKDQIRQIFDVTHFSSIFSIYPSQEEAIKSFQ